MRSCRTLSPLPVPKNDPEPGRYPFCGTIPDPLSPKGYSEPPGVTRRRGSMEPGLSSPRLRRPRPPNPLASGDIGESVCSFESERKCPLWVESRLQELRLNADGPLELPFSGNRTITGHAYALKFRNVAIAAEGTVKPT